MSETPTPECFPSEFPWRKWRTLGVYGRWRAGGLLGGDRTPLESFLVPPAPRTVALQHRWDHDLSAFSPEYQHLVDRCAATRGWVYASKEVPDREGPDWKLDVVFHVGDRPVIARFEDNGDKMHGVGGARVHDQWFRRLMRTGAEATVFYDHTGNCMLFGDMRPYIWVGFAEMLEQAMQAEDAEEIRDCVDTCLEIMQFMDDRSRVSQAIQRSSGPVPVSTNPSDWCGSAFTVSRLGTADLRGQLRQMLPFLDLAGHWFWAASWPPPRDRRR